MELSAEAMALIAANGSGAQSTHTRCHFCAYPGRHLYVFVECSSEPTECSSEPAECSSEPAECSAECSAESGPACVVLGNFAILSLGESVGSDCEIAGVRARGEYRGYCDHIDWDGTPWCDGCVMLGCDGDIVYPCCPRCCGASWGRPDPAALPEQAGRRYLWSPACEALWEGSRAAV